MLFSIKISRFPITANQNFKQLANFDSQSYKKQYNVDKPNVVFVFFIQKI